jgi:hypothetical protein
MVVVSAGQTVVHVVKTKLTATVRSFSSSERKRIARPSWSTTGTSGRSSVKAASGVPACDETVCDVTVAGAATSHAASPTAAA